MADINLLPSEEKTAERIDLARKKLLFVSIAVLVFTAILTLATLVFFTRLVSVRKDMFAKVEESTAQISDLKTTEELITVVKQKASTAHKIISARSNISYVFDQLKQLTPQEVYFSDLRISSGKIVISGKAKSSKDMNWLIKNLTEEGAGIVSDVAIDSLSSDETGAYTFAISAQLVGFK